MANKSVKTPRHIWELDQGYSPPSFMVDQSNRWVCRLCCEGRYSPWEPSDVTPPCKCAG